MFAYGQKTLGLPKEFARLSLTLQVKQAAQIVRRHFCETGGELTVWGTISGYRLQRTCDHAVGLNKEGTVRVGCEGGVLQGVVALRVGE